MGIPDTSAIDKKLAKNSAARALLIEQKDALLRETTVTCAKGHTHPIKDLTYVQTHWYTEPHGCTGGDYWNVGEGQYKCPECGGERYRLYTAPEIMRLKYLFKDVVETHDR